MPEAVARRRAAAVAGHRGDVATARRYVDDSDPGVRATALGALARSGGLTLDDLARGFADTQPSVRARAAELTAALADGAGPDAPAALSLVQVPAGRA
jgi:HEAT repeat protein